MQVHQSESSSRVRVIWLLRHLGLSLFSHEFAPSLAILLFNLNASDRISCPSTNYEKATTGSGPCVFSKSE